VEDSGDGNRLRPHNVNQQVPAHVDLADVQVFPSRHERTRLGKKRQLAQALSQFLFKLFEFVRTATRQSSSDSFEVGISLRQYSILKP
jgi:hypothetical protein